MVCFYTRIVKKKQQPQFRCSSDLSAVIKLLNVMQINCICRIIMICLVAKKCAKDTNVNEILGKSHILILDSSQMLFRLLNCTIKW